MKTSESLFVPVRGLRYHCRCWGDERATKLFMLHGWMDVSASFQFLVDALRRDWRVIAPDWRGLDRKSTRLNSSHLVISYAVFCLKKKKKQCTKQADDT